MNEVKSILNVLLLIMYGSIGAADDSLIGPQTPACEMTLWGIEAVSGAKPVRRKQHRPKTISAQGLSGQQGINLIERTVLQMGSRWTPSGPNEIGIDGYIELFDPNSRQALGVTLAVQSKVVSAISDVGKQTFDYWCDANDVEYWLNGNTPVILVVSNPPSDEAYWVSIKDYFKGWKLSDSTRVTFVKSERRFDATNFRHLLAIAAPKRGLYLAPVRRTEQLHSNLLPLDGLPPHVFIATTDCRCARDVWALARRSTQEVDGAWVLWEKKIISFHDLSESPWPVICETGTVEGFATSEWAASTDAQRQRIFVQLLNQTLRAQLSPTVRYWPKEDCYAITGTPRKLSYQSLKRSSKITVVSKFSKTAADGRGFEWFRHLAFRGQFRFLEGTWFLEITPTYRFTCDGSMLDRFHPDRLKGIKRIEGNRAVLSCVLFWADHLKPKTNLFDGTPPPLQFGSLLTFDSGVGIVDREWLADDPDFARATSIESKTLFPDEGLDL